MTQTACEITWLSYLFRDLGISILATPIIYSDNLSALNLTINPVMHSRSKHVQLDHHFIRAKVALKLIDTAYLHNSNSLQISLQKHCSKDLFLSFVPSWIFCLAQLAGEFLFMGSSWRTLVLTFCRKIYSLYDIWGRCSFGGWKISSTRLLFRGEGWETIDKLQTFVFDLRKPFITFNPEESLHRILRHLKRRTETKLGEIFVLVISINILWCICILLEWDMYCKWAGDLKMDFTFSIKNYIGSF